MKSCVKKIARLTLWMLLGLIIGAFIGTLISQIYELLFEYFPDTFPLYNPVFEKEKYDRFTLTMAFISLSLTLALTVYICQRFNNDRFEFMIAKTEGLYKIREVLRTYVDKFAASDVAESIIVALLFTVPIYFIPKGFFTKSTFIVDLLLPLRTVIDGVGITGAVLDAILALLLSHALTLPLILKFYRAKWLTGFAEGVV